jgi:hypothetical protein
MSTGMGLFHWTEDQFWNTTFRAFNAAVRGHNVAQGNTPELTAEDYVEMEKAQDEFPDVVGSIADG